MRLDELRSLTAGKTWEFKHMVLTLLEKIVTELKDK